MRLEVGLKPVLYTAARRLRGRLVFLLALGLAAALGLLLVLGSAQVLAHASIDHLRGAY